MYETHPEFHEPDINSLIWRYMTMGKFVSLLHTGSLFFSRIDILDDAYEGRLPRPTYEMMSPNVRRLYEQFRPYLVVNCWSMGEQESVALWDRYVGSGEGVAICSTFARLKDSFNNEGDLANVRVHIGQVSYVDFTTHSLIGGPDDLAPNIYKPLLHKRRCFDFEHELRVVLIGCANDSLSQQCAKIGGVYVPVDLVALIGRLHVAPRSRSWLLAGVKSLASKYGLPENLVVTSDLDEPPPGVSS